MNMQTVNKRNIAILLVLTIGAIMSACGNTLDNVNQRVVTLVNAKTPVYFVIGESDEYYGSEPFRDAYQEIYYRYIEQGLSEQEIDSLLVLDVKDADYFDSGRMNNQHGGGAALFCKDSDIMGWLFQK